jgi:hypothetical protein
VLEQEVEETAAARAAVEAAASAAAGAATVLGAEKAAAQKEREGLGARSMRARWQQLGRLNLRTEVPAAEPFLVAIAVGGDRRVGVPGVRQVVVLRVARVWYVLPRPRTCVVVLLGELRQRCPVSPPPSRKSSMTDATRRCDVRARVAVWR